ncbi:MAG: hypothetical protein GTO22_03115, partial [Gemmatimonadales bacterium]|nr:hypothetical protein [Gemmatimonadales bacterium]
LCSEAGPLRVSPENQGALEPTWSPDGTRIAYWVDHMTFDHPDHGNVYHAFSLWVANADGSGAAEVYNADTWLKTIGWDWSGDA